MLSIGLLGIIVELWNPGLIFPGTVGAISLIVGLYGLQVLPVSAAGVLLMLLAAGFFVAELFVTSHGALTLAGAVTFVIGALLLFDPAGPAYQVSLPVALAIAGTISAFMVFAVGQGRAGAAQACRGRASNSSSAHAGSSGATATSSCTGSCGARGPPGTAAPPARRPRRGRGRRTISSLVVGRPSSARDPPSPSRMAP